MTDIETIVENFEYLDDWDDRYRYLIELGESLDPLPGELKTAATKVQGCVSQVWIVTEKSVDADPVLTFRGDSDSHIVRGLIAIALAIFSGRHASEVATTDENPIFEKIRLAEHITPQRSNGLRSMVRRIKKEAELTLACD